jgi:hypothetical protein
VNHQGPVSNGRIQLCPADGPWEQGASACAQGEEMFAV